MRTTVATAEAQGALTHALAGLTCFTLLPLFHFQLFFLLLESMRGNLSVTYLAWVVLPSVVTRVPILREWARQHMRSLQALAACLLTASLAAGAAGYVSIRLAMSSAGLAVSWGGCQAPQWGGAQGTAAMNGLLDGNQLALVLHLAAGLLPPPSPTLRLLLSLPLAVIMVVVLPLLGGRRRINQHSRALWLDGRRVDADDGRPGRQGTHRWGLQASALRIARVPSDRAFFRTGSKRPGGRFYDGVSARGGGGATEAKVSGDAHARVEFPEGMQLLLPSPLPSETCGSGVFGGDRSRDAGGYDPGDILMQEPPEPSSRGVGGGREAGDVEQLVVIPTAAAASKAPRAAMGRETNPVEEAAKRGLDVWEKLGAESDERGEQRPPRSHEDDGERRAGTPPESPPGRILPERHLGSSSPPEAVQQQRGSPCQNLGSPGGVSAWVTSAGFGGLLFLTVLLAGSPWTGEEWAPSPRMGIGWSALRQSSVVLAWSLGQALVHLPVIRSRGFSRESRAETYCQRFSMIPAFPAPSLALLMAVAVLAAFPEHALVVVPTMCVVAAVLPLLWHDLGRLSSTGIGNDGAVVYILLTVWEESLVAFEYAPPLRPLRGTRAFLLVAAACMAIAPSLSAAPRRPSDCGVEGPDGNAYDGEEEEPRGLDSLGGGDDNRDDERESHYNPDQEHNVHDFGDDYDRQEEQQLRVRLLAATGRGDGGDGGASGEVGDIDSSSSGDKAGTAPGYNRRIHHRGGYGSPRGVSCGDYGPCPGALEAGERGRCPVVSSPSAAAAATATTAACQGTYPRVGDAAWVISPPPPAKSATTAAVQKGIALVVVIAGLTAALAFGTPSTSVKARWSSQACSRGSEAVRLVNFNVYMGYDRRGEDNAFRVGALLKGLKADVAVLQETGLMRLTLGNRRYGGAVARAAGMILAAAAPVSEDTWGCVILSRLPVVSWGWRRLPRGVGENACEAHATLSMGRGMGVATVVNVHLGNEGTIDNDQQVEGLLELLRDLRRSENQLPGLPASASAPPPTRTTTAVPSRSYPARDPTQRLFIVAGDFNFDSSSAGYRRLVEEGRLRSAAADVELEAAAAAAAPDNISWSSRGLGSSSDQVPGTTLNGNDAGETFNITAASAGGLSQLLPSPSSSSEGFRSSRGFPLPGSPLTSTSAPWWRRTMEAGTGGVNHSDVPYSLSEETAPKNNPKDAYSPSESGPPTRDNPDFLGDAEYRPPRRASGNRAELSGVSTGGVPEMTELASRLRRSGMPKVDDVTGSAEARATSRRFEEYALEGAGEFYAAKNGDGGVRDQGSEAMGSSRGGGASLAAGVNADAEVDAADVSEDVALDFVFYAADRGVSLEGYKVHREFSQERYADGYPSVTDFEVLCVPTE